MSKWDYSNKIHREKYKQRRILLDQLKSNPCTDCHIRYPVCCMDFDHIGADKVFEISKRINGNWDKILIEINKCELVCSNCHRIRTYQRSLQQRNK